MRIAIDYTAAAWQGAGIGRYTRELVRAIAARGGDFHYILFYAAGGLDRHSPYLAALRQLCAAHPSVRAVPIPLTPSRLTQIWQRLRLPIPVELYTGPIDILHAPDFVSPPTRARTILTIHDLSFLVHPECAEPSMVRYLSRAVPRCLRRADVVLADSQATCRDLVRLLAVDAARVKVLYPGVGPQFRPMLSEQAEALRRKLDLPERFLLFVGTLEPRKNLVRLIEAFAQVIEPRTGTRKVNREPGTKEQRTTNNEQTQEPGITRRVPDQGPTDSLQLAICNLQSAFDNGPRTTDNLHLVIAGRRGWLYHDIFATIARLGLGERVWVLDFVDDNDLPALYNLAEAFVYPSIYEGFGLPALEAMACGVPVLTANNSSLPEVVGDAAELVLAEDSSSIAAGIERIARDEALRVRLRAAGLEQAQSFTWERAAEQVLACYQRIGAAI